MFRTILILLAASAAFGADLTEAEVCSVGALFAGVMWALSARAPPATPHNYPHNRRRMSREQPRQPIKPRWKQAT